MNNKLDMILDAINHLSTRIDKIEKDLTDFRVEVKARFDNLILKNNLVE